jgi:hypothetical protein
LCVAGRRFWGGGGIQNRASISRRVKWRAVARGWGAVKRFREVLARWRRSGVVLLPGQRAIVVQYPVAPIWRRFDYAPEIGQAAIYVGRYRISYLWARG